MGIKTNLVMLSGLVMQDPSRDETRSGAPFARFKIRHQDTYQKPDGGTVDTSHMHDIVAYTRLGNWTWDNVRAGHTVNVTGKFALLNDRKHGPLTTIVATAIDIVYTPKEAGALC